MMNDPYRGHHYDCYCCYYPSLIYYFDLYHDLSYDCSNYYQDDPMSAMMMMMGDLYHDHYAMTMMMDDRMNDLYHFDPIDYAMTIPTMKQWVIWLMK